jgi:hypothetical protein
VADLYRVRVESISGPCLTCRVTELYGEGYHLVSSRTLAFGFLWDTTAWVWWMDLLPDEPDHTIEAMQTAAESTALGQELARHDRFGAGADDWCRANVGRFISCVGVVDRRTVTTDEKEWSHYTPGMEIPEATYNISVTDPRWLAHLKPGMTWESRVWDRDGPVVCNPEWRTSDVALLSKRIDESREFSALPILADALQDAGCDADDLLNHLRDTTAAHVRGCWALDLVLGKE